MYVWIFKDPICHFACRLLDKRACIFKREIYQNCNSALFMNAAQHWRLFRRLKKQLSFFFCHPLEDSLWVRTLSPCSLSLIGPLHKCSFVKPYMPFCSQLYHFSRRQRPQFPRIWQKSGHEPHKGLDNKTDWLAVSRNATLTLSLQPWRWRQYVAPKRWPRPAKLRGSKTRKNIYIILAAVKTNLTGNRVWLASEQSGLILKRFYYHGRI
jgi:hypothetical protein